MEVTINYLIAQLVTIKNFDHGLADVFASVRARNGLEPNLVGLVLPLMRLVRRDGDAVVRDRQIGITLLAGPDVDSEGV